MQWFSEEFNFDENDIIRKQKSLEKIVKILNDQYNIFEINKKIFYAGKFEYPTLEELTTTLISIKKGESNKTLKDYCFVLDQKEYRMPGENSIKKGEISQENPIEPPQNASKNIEGHENMEEEKEVKEPFNDFNDEDTKKDLSSPSKIQFKGLKFSHINNKPVKTLICDEKNNEAVFQVASQFNCLEMIGPSVKPDEGITKYVFDQTQGPECALCCRSALFYRNYLVNGGGQVGGKQINMLVDIENLVDNKTNKYWVVKNGYCLTDDAIQVQLLKERLNNDKKLADNIKNKLKVGIHWDTEVNLKKPHGSNVFNSPSQQRICQVFGSTLALSYDKQIKDQKKIWDPFCSLLLEASYDATLTAAAILAHLKQKRIKVFLTAIGGGVFGNPKLWIANAIKKSLMKHTNEPLDVFLVHYSSIPEVFQKELPKI